MEAIYIIFGIIIYGGGLITGVYISSQVESHIEKRTNAKQRKQLHCNFCWLLWNYISNTNFAINVHRKFMSTGLFAIIVFIWWLITYTLIQEHGNKETKNKDVNNKTEQ